MSRQVKPGSRPYRAQLRERLAALGFSERIIPVWVAEHLIAECEVRPRTAWRLSAELSLDMAARHYNTLHGGPSAGMRGSRIWEFEQWPDRGVRPTLSALRILAHVYGTDWQSLLDLRDLEQLPPRDLAEYRRAAEPVPVTPSSPDEGEWLPRSFAGAGAGQNALTDAMILTKTNVDATQLDDLWSDLNYLGNAYARTSPASVLRQLSVVHERATSLLRARQRPKQSRDLYLLSAKCCAMMAWTSADLGRYGAAQELNSAAWLYGQYADDFLARRWVRTTQSRVEYWAGNGRESARLAADGLTYKVSGGMTDAPLILAEARGWASVEAEKQVLDAIGRWTRAEDRVPNVVGEDRFFNISKDRQHYVAGTSLLSVGRADLALREFGTARKDHGALAPEFRWEAMAPMIQIDTARAYLRQGELDGAADELESFLSADVGWRHDMVRAMLKVVTRELAAPRWQRSKIVPAIVAALTDVLANC